MLLKVSIVKTLDLWWIDDETAQDLPDDHLVKLARETISAFLEEDAEWSVERIGADKVLG